MKADNEFKKMKMIGNISANLIIDDSQIFQMKDATGYGEMRMNKVLDGIYIMYNDFHMQNCMSYLKNNSEVFCIDHCREGRIETSKDGLNYYYIEAGDIRVDDRQGHDSEFFFPLSHYYGLTIIFFYEQAQASLRKTFSEFPVDLREVMVKFSSGKLPVQMEHIGHPGAEKLY